MLGRNQYLNTKLFQTFGKDVAETVYGCSNAAVSELGEKIRCFRESNGLTQGAFGAKLGVSDQTISNVESGVTKSLQKNLLPLLSEIIGVPIAEVMKMVPKRERKVKVQELKPPIPDGVDMATWHDVKPIPLWEIDISASRWAYIPIAELDWHDPAQRAVIDQGRFRLKIRGDCMEHPKDGYGDGSLIEFEIIRPDMEGPEVGRDYVWCRNDNTGTFKRLLAMDEDTYTLVALNRQSVPEPFKVARQEITRIAKVVFRLTGPAR